MKFSTLILLPFLLILSQGCNRQENIDVRLTEADSLMMSNPEKSLEILESIGKPHYSGEELNAYYALLLSQARYRNFIDAESDSLIMVAVKYYETTGDRRNLACAYLYAGCVNGELGDEEKDLYFTQKAAETAEKTVDYGLLTHIYYHWGRILCDKKPYNMAIEYFEKSKKYAEAEGDKRYIANNFYELSRIYTYQNDLHKAKEMIDSAIQLKSRLSVMYTMQSMILKQLDMPKQALNAIEKAQGHASGDLDSTVIYSCKGDIFLCLNQLDSAECYIKRSKDNDSYYSRADYENLMSELEEKRGDYRQSLIHSRNYARLLDTIKMEEDSSRIMAMQRRYDYARVERDRNELEMESQRKTIVILLMAFAAACCAVVATIYISQRRKRNSRRLLAKEQMLAQANAEIADKTALLLAERQQKSEIGQRLRQVSGVMRKINALKSKDCGEAVKLSREDIYDLALILNQTNDNFAERLRKKHPDLSDNDYGLCLMTKLGISNKGMSLLLDTTEAAVRKRKSRLKNNRLQADGFETLEEYVESI